MLPSENVQIEKYWEKVCMNVNWNENRNKRTYVLNSYLIWTHNITLWLFRFFHIATKSKRISLKGFWHFYDAMHVMCSKTHSHSIFVLFTTIFVLFSVARILIYQLPTSNGYRKLNQASIDDDIVKLTENAFWNEWKCVVGETYCIYAYSNSVVPVFSIRFSLLVSCGYYFYSLERSSS